MGGARRRFAAARYWYPPLPRPEFWVTQALVVTVAVLHTIAESTGFLGALGDAYVFSVALFLIPVLYAAAAFGLRGSLPTAIWAAVVMVPNLILASGPSARIGELWQLGVILLLGAFVGLRVDREVGARSDAERREWARIASEQRYRSLFEGAPIPILITDVQGIIQEANASAAALVGQDARELRGRTLAAVVGPEITGMVMGDEEPRAILIETEPADRTWVLPASIPCGGPDDRPWIQTILRDVTAQEERQRGIEAYARRTLAGREEERRRLARELHDGPLQSVIMLSRRLSCLEQPPSSEGGENLNELRSLALGIATELRQTSRNLRPSILDDVGLSAALRAEGALVGLQHAIAVDFKLAGSPRGLPAATELTLLRVTQEALRNVVRHAGASKVLIKLSYRPGSVRLSIADDGSGPGGSLARDELLAAGKLGVVGMIERASLLGATCRIRAPRRGGTIVAILVPDGPMRRRSPTTTVLAHNEVAMAMSGDPRP